MRKVVAAAVAVTAIMAGSGFAAWKWHDAKAGGIALPDCPGSVFARQALVFDVLAVCATAGVPADKLAHAANVAAEWLDNDGDGNVDEPRLIDAMQTNRPFVVMTPDGPGMALMARLAPTLDTRAGQDLAADETNPGGGRRDASQEEIHHLIHVSGWQVAFPEIFSEEPGSALYQQWALAEGEGHYHYDDPTCNDRCKVVEFFYLATAAWFEARADLEPDEMQLKNRAQLMSGLPDTVALMTSADYTYPLDHWPTGVYEHRQNIVYTPPAGPE